MSRSLFAIVIFLSVLQGSGWQPDFAAAKKAAVESNLPILISFSGSDWCGPCIRMKKEIFEDTSFSNFAANRLVLFNADFPRNKKNQLSPQAKKENDMLAALYNPDGAFPYTILIDTTGKLLRSWNGLPASQQKFITELKQTCDAAD